jgi:hypothetical protein
MAGFSNVRDPVPDPKLDTLPAEVPIYFYGGHGEDVCDPVTHELRVETVPENCIYITTGQCGLPTYDTSVKKFIRIFRDPSETARTLLRYPYLEKNLAEMSRQTGIGVDSLHIHLPGSTYVVSRIRPPMSWNTATHFGMLFSGISEKRLLEQASPLAQAFVEARKPFLEESLLGWFPDCLPQPKKEAFVKLQQALRPDPRRSSTFKRKESKNLLNRMFEGQDTVTRKDIIRYMNELQNMMSIQSFLGLFSASVVPTQSEVREIVKNTTTALDDDTIYGYDIENVSKILSKTEILASDLMRTYPGIHYNIACRVLSQDCQSVDPSVRRAVSNADEQRRREALRGVGAPAERAGGRRRRTRRAPGPHPRTKRLTRKKTIVKSSR